MGARGRFAEKGFLILRVRSHRTWVGTLGQGLKLEKPETEGAG